MKTKFIVILVLLGLLFRNPAGVLASTGNSSSVSEQSGFIDVGTNEATVTFADLGFQETTLVSPFDSTRVLFSIPANWRLAPGGEVQLDYELTLTGADAALVQTDQNPYGGSMTVTFNDELVSTIALNKLGPQSIQLSLPETALTAVRADGRHQLAISLSAESSCIYNIRAIVVIRPTSTFKLPFEVSSPELDLSRLPAPFHLRDALLPDKTLVVVPNDPDTKELEAALNVMSGFGALVGQTSDIGLVSADELTDTVLAENHLIFVGRPEQFDALNEINFPLVVENKKFAALPAESQTDGVLEMAVSPWNESKAALLVSGASVEAVMKAAQALSSGRVLVYENPELAYVADVQVLAEALPVVEDFTLQNLGYTTQTISGIGVNSVQYLFNVSREQVQSQEGTIDLLYYHSGLIDYGLSSFTVELNNQAIASAPFVKESEQLTTLQIKIPPGLLRYGENRLTVSARLFALTSCDQTGFSNPWLTISDQSKIHLPPAPEGSAISPWLLDLKFYPDLFSTYSDLGDVAFVLPKTEPSTWKLAGQIAYQLGRTANPLISNLEVAFADDVPQQVLDQNALIVIGKSSTLPFLSQINDQLPAPFDQESNTASEANMQIVYRIPSGMSVGYLELLNSPFNVEKPILVLSGNSDEGLTMAGDALLVNELRSQLTGVFAVTNGTQIATANASSLFSAVGTLVPPEQSVVTTPLPVSPPATAALTPPSWLFPVLLASGIAILLVIGVVIVSALARRRETEPPKLNGGSHPENHDNTRR